VQTDTNNKDEYELRLEQKLRELQECQQEQNLDSCMKCEKIFECELRKSYVEGVYESMRKGEEGGFEF